MEKMNTTEITDAGKKRARKSNFSPTEIIRLLELILENKGIIMASFSSDVTNKKKAEAWKIVAAGVSAVGFVARSPDEVKEKWSNVKKEFRTREAARRRTGHGAVPEKATDQLVELIVGKESELVEGIRGGGHDTFLEVFGTLSRKRPRTSSDAPASSASCSTSRGLNSASNSPCGPLDNETLGLENSDEAAVTQTFDLDTVMAHSTPIKSTTPVPMFAPTFAIPFGVSPPSAGIQIVDVEVHHPSTSSQASDTDSRPMFKDPLLREHQRQQPGTDNSRKVSTVKKPPQKQKQTKDKVSKDTDENGHNVWHDYLRSQTILNNIKIEQKGRQAELLGLQIKRLEQEIRISEVKEKDDCEIRKLKIAKLKSM